MYYYIIKFSFISLHCLYIIIECFLIAIDDHIDTKFNIISIKKLIKRNKYKGSQKEETKISLCSMLI